MNKKFVELCQKKGVTANKVATELKISSGLVSEWKHGKKGIGTKHIMKLADYFGVPVEYLLKDDV